MSNKQEKIKKIKDMMNANEAEYKSDLHFATNDKEKHTAKVEYLKAKKYLEDELKKAEALEESILSESVINRIKKLLNEESFKVIFTIANGKGEQKTATYTFAGENQNEAIKRAKEAYADDEEYDGFTIKNTKAEKAKDYTTKK